MSSIDPEATRKFARTANGRGLALGDSPLSGGAPKALIGELTLMMGGDAADVARAQKVLGSVASNMTHMGGPGAGQTTRIINQVLCGLGLGAAPGAPGSTWNGLLMRPGLHLLARSGLRGYRQPIRCWGSPER